MRISCFVSCINTFNQTDKFVAIMCINPNREKTLWRVTLICSCNIHQIINFFERVDFEKWIAWEGYARTKPWTFICFKSACEHIQKWHFYGQLFGSSVTGLPDTPISFEDITGTPSKYRFPSCLLTQLRFHLLLRSRIWSTFEWKWTPFVLLV